MQWQLQLQKQKQQRKFVLLQSSIEEARLNFVAQFCSSKITTLLYRVSLSTSIFIQKSKRQLCAPKFAFQWSIWLAGWLAGRAIYDVSLSGLFSFRTSLSQLNIILMMTTRMGKNYTHKIYSIL